MERFAKEFARPASESASRARDIARPANGIAWLAKDVCPGGGDEVAGAKDYEHKDKRKQENSRNGKTDR